LAFQPDRDYDSGLEEKPRMLLYSGLSIGRKAVFRQPLG
jgi:hypothetical protein